MGVGKEAASVVGTVTNEVVAAVEGIGDALVYRRREDEPIGWIVGEKINPGTPASRDGDVYTGSPSDDVTCAGECTASVLGGGSEDVGRKLEEVSHLRLQSYILLTASSYLSKFDYPNCSLTYL